MKKTLPSELDSRLKWIHRSRNAGSKNTSILFRTRVGRDIVSNILDSSICAKTMGQGLIPATLKKNAIFTWKRGVSLLSYSLLTFDSTENMMPILHMLLDIYWWARTELSTMKPKAAASSSKTSVVVEVVVPVTVCVSAQQPLSRSTRFAMQCLSRGRSVQYKYNMCYSIEAFMMI